jgi:hypothetical protein
MTTDNLSTKTAVQTLPAAQSADNPVQAQVFQDMLTILNELVSHTHIFYDDYSTACNCNCNCNCSRGIL